MQESVVYYDRVMSSTLTALVALLAHSTGTDAVRHVQATAKGLLAGLTGDMTPLPPTTEIFQTAFNDAHEKARLVGVALREADAIPVQPIPALSAEELATILAGLRYLQNHADENEILAGPLGDILTSDDGDIGDLWLSDADVDALCERLNAESTPSTDALVEAYHTLTAINSELGTPTLRRIADVLGYVPA